MERRILLCLLIIVFVFQRSGYAQDTVSLVIAIDDLLQPYLNDDHFADFKAAYPNTKIIVKTISFEERFVASPISPDDVGRYIEQLQNYASSGDVLFVEDANLVSEAIQTGVFLDLSPLIQANTNAQIEDFYPALLQSFQRGSRIFALPVSGSVNLLLFNRTAFDNMMLPYPTPDWTITAFRDTAKALAVMDAQGNMITPGISRSNFSGLLRALYRYPLETTAEGWPQFDTPEMTMLMEQAQPLYELSGRTEGDFLSIPMQIGGIFLLDENVNSSSDADFEAVLLPNYTAGVNVQGFAVSAGTAHPELAYALVQYMTNHPEIAGSIYGALPARRSLSTAEFAQNMGYDTEIFTLTDDALNHAFPASEQYPFRILERVLEHTTENETDPQIALREVQEELYSVYEAIIEMSGDIHIIVGTPVPVPEVNPDKITLRFGMNGLPTPLANRNIWNTTITDFITAHPTVGQILLDTDFMSLKAHIETQDCFFLETNVIPIDHSLLLDITPLLNADPTYNEADMVNKVMKQVAADGGTWGFPMTLYPLILWYDSRQFEVAGVPQPAVNWTITEFEDALRQLKDDTANAPFSTEYPGDLYLRMLIAGYGGRFYDDMTMPTTYYLTEPETINAVRQVLNLARMGYIRYQELASNFGGYFGPGGLIYASYLDTNGFRLAVRNSGDPYRVVMFPRGSRYAPAAYLLGVTYISPQSLYPELCYQWIRQISDTVGLFNGMPARRPLLESSALAFTEGDDLLVFYHEFDVLLQSSDVFVFNLWGQTSTYNVTSTNLDLGWPHWWVNRAFDNIVLREGDVEVELQTAQTFIIDYQACTSNIPAPTQPIEEMDMEAQTAYFSLFSDCALAVDPSLAEILNPQ